MNRFYTCFSSAIRGLHPHVSDRHIRELQSGYVMELVKGQPIRDCERVGSREYLYLDIVVKGERK